MYSHDGLKDSLTNLAAPPLFYEELRREFAQKNRSRGEVQILRLVLHKEGDEPVSETESIKAVAEFGQILVSITRGHDVCARMGEYEFLVLFTGEKFSIASFVHRLAHQWNFKHRGLALSSSFLVSHSDETGLDLLNRLDLEALTGCATGDI